MGQPMKPGMLGMPRALAVRCQRDRPFRGASAGSCVTPRPISTRASRRLKFSPTIARPVTRARGLANGRGSSGLASFLVEHYTASKDQAAALAAYVMGAGGGDAGGTRTWGEAGAGPQQSRGRGGQALRQRDNSASPRKGRPRPHKLQPPAGEEPKRLGDVPRIMQEPGGGRKPANRDSYPGQQALSARLAGEPPRGPPTVAVLPQVRLPGEHRQ